MSQYSVIEICIGKFLAIRISASSASKKSRTIRGGQEMTMTKRMAAAVTVFLVLTCGLKSPALSQNHFSRANCWNNESISWTVVGGYHWRVVFSRHFKNGTKKHYVTENPPVYPTCLPGFNGNHQVNGLSCSHWYTKELRHAGVHGAFLSSEPNPDGTLSPGTTSAWSVQGVHHRWIKSINKFLLTETEASDCNGVPGQFCC